MNTLKYKDLKYYQKLDKDLAMIPITYDKQFKSVFVSNEEIFKDFLITELQLDMIPEKTDLLVSNSELISDVNKEYRKTVDIVVYLNENITVDVEANRSPYNGLIVRNSMYFAKLCGQALEEGDDDADIKKKQLYQLNINAHSDDNKFGEKKYNLKSDEVDDVLFENIGIYLENIAFYRNLYYNEHKELTKRELWLVALSSESFTELYEILIQILTPDKVERFMESVILMSQNAFGIKDWERKKLDEIAYQDGLDYAEEVGLQKGIEQNKLEIARNLLNKGMDIQDISDVTGLSKEEIKSLSENKE